MKDCHKICAAEWFNLRVENTDLAINVGGKSLRLGGQVTTRANLLLEANIEPVIPAGRDRTRNRLRHQRSQCLVKSANDCWLQSHAVFNGNAAQRLGVRSSKNTIVPRPP